MRQLKGLTLILLATVSGCATLNEDECQTADWQAIGYEDGASGEPSTRMGSHREACARYGITPELRKYKRGYEEGLVVYCTAGSGYNRAVNGHEYKGVCPITLEADFLEGYNDGRKIYLAASEVDSLESQQQSNENEQHRLKELLKKKEAALFDSDTSEQQRRAIYENISALNQRQGSLQQERDELIRDLSKAQIRLRALRSQYRHH